VFPRTPGRDYAGVVLDGPDGWIGREVFGSSGDLGIRRDGTHASHLVVEAAALVEKPQNITMEEAAGIGVPFVTAIEGFRRSGMPKPGEHVLIMGVNGKVGQAAVQLATWLGANVIGVVLTDGKGANIVFNTVGDPYFPAAHKSLAKGGRQILIAAIDKIVQFNILEFYRGRHTYVGIDTLAFSSVESGEVLRSVLPGFADGKLKPYPISEASVYPLSEAKRAYVEVIGSSRDRVLLRPGA
jgi:NADPH:quinone reductase